MKIGIIGFGFMGGVHLAAIERLNGVTVTAIASRTKPLPDAPPRGNLDHVKSSRFPADTPWYSDWRQLLDSDIDAVDICLPTHLHKEVALRALERGKHVLCEKPMALTARDCDELLEAANKSGRVLMVAHVLRFAYPYLFAASFIHEHCDGMVKECAMTRRAGYPQWSEWLSQKECSGGAVLDLLIHDIDQAVKLFGEPTAVSAVSDGEIDTMRGTLHYASGLKVRIAGGWYAPETPFSAGFRIEGPDASLSFQDGVLQQNVWGQKQLIEIPEHNEYFEEMKYFVECCTNHAVPARCLPEESAQAVRLANLMKESRDRDGKEMPFDAAAS
jgi:predicted dehydrogenase